MGVFKNQCYKMNKNGKRCKLKCIEDTDTCHIHHVTYYDDSDYIYDVIDTMQDNINSLKEEISDMLKNTQEIKKEYSSKLNRYQFVTMLLCAYNVYTILSETNFLEESKYIIDNMWSQFI